MQVVTLMYIPDLHVVPVRWINRDGSCYDSPILKGIDLRDASQGVADFASLIQTRKSERRPEPAVDKLRLSDQHINHDRPGQLTRRLASRDPQQSPISPTAGIGGCFTTRRRLQMRTPGRSIVLSVATVIDTPILTKPEPLGVVTNAASNPS